jgi:protein SYS1
MSETSTAEYQPLQTSTSSSGGHFRPQVFDPLLTLTQIGAVQSIYYVSSTILLLGGSYFIEFPFLSLRSLFDADQLSLSTSAGKYLIALYFLNALVLSLSLTVLVRRSKLCLDFVGTCYFFHFILSWLFTLQFPLSVTWWTVQVLSAILATLLGEYLCLRGEMEAIPVGQNAKVDV